MSNEKPVATVRIGAIKASVWRNSNREGKTWYTVTLTRSYKDEKDQWQETQSFGSDDLLPLAKACDLAHTHVMQFQAEAREIAKRREGGAR